MRRVISFRSKFISCLLIALFAATGYPLATQAQQFNESNTATEEQLKKQLAELELRKAILEAERSILNNSLPKVTEASKPLEGTTTISGSTTQAGNTTFESQVLAYQALREIVKALAADLSEVRGVSSIVILDENTLKNLTAYQYYTYLYRNLLQAYKDESQRESIPNLSALEVPTTLLRSVADFLALFRTDTTINNFQITLPPSSLAVQLARQLRSTTSRPISVLYPQWYAQDFSVIQEQLQELFKAKKEAEASLKNSSKELRDQKQERLNQLQKKFDEFIAYVSTLENITILSKGAKIANTLLKDGSHVLFLTLEAGGSNRTTRNLFSGTRTRHSGGVILNYALFNPQGETITSNTLYYHTGYIAVPTDKPITNITNIR